MRPATAPAAVEPVLSASQRERPPPAEFSGGEKAKARDILAAIRALKSIEGESRFATDEEKETLRRFAGFGPVALSIFPNPATGQYKDATWETLGEELRSLLTSEEYASARRTTFNAFYTSPTVIAAIHEAIGRLGVPNDALILEPGCGTGNFLGHGNSQARYIGVELDLISGRIARALHPRHDIRIENFGDTRLPENRLDAAIGNVPFADLHERQSHRLCGGMIGGLGWGEKLRQPLLTGCPVEPARP